MSEGVSLSLPRNGFPVGHSLEISDPCAMELGRSQVSSLISVSLSRELVSLCERNSSVFSQVVLAIETDLVIDLPAALKGDPLYLGSGDESMPLFFGSIDPDPVLCERNDINAFPKKEVCRASKVVPFSSDEAKIADSISAYGNAVADAILVAAADGLAGALASDPQGCLFSGLVSSEMGDRKNSSRLGHVGVGVEFPPIPSGFGSGYVSSEVPAHESGVASITTTDAISDVDGKADSNVAGGNLYGLWVGRRNVGSGAYVGNVMGQSQSSSLVCAAIALPGIPLDPRGPMYHPAPVMASTAGLFLRDSISNHRSTARSSRLVSMPEREDCVDSPCVFGTGNRVLGFIGAGGPTQVNDGLVPHFWDPFLVETVLKGTAHCAMAIVASASRWDWWQLMGISQWDVRRDVMGRSMIFRLIGINFRTLLFFIAPLKFHKSWRFIYLGK